VETTLEFAVRLARQAGDLLLGYFKKSDLSSSYKSDRSIVTEADLAADQLITNTIKDHYPDNLVLSEELSPVYLDQNTFTDNSLWIIDPLDGTTNFSLGLPIWGIILTRLIDGLPETAVINFPVLGEVFSVQKNQGAFLNQDRLEIRPNDPKQSRSFFSCCSRAYGYYQVDIPYKIRILGSAGYSMCAVARGSAIVSFEARAKIWDIAAPWLLIKEAGGAIETLDYSQPFPLQSGCDYSNQSFPTLAAINSEILSRARRKIIPRD